MEQPPLLSDSRQNAKRKRGMAFVLNFVLPGAGNWHYGQRRLGAVLIVVFLASFAWAAIHYISTMEKAIELGFSGDLLKGDNLEQLEASYNDGSTNLALTISFVVFCTSLATLAKK